MSDETKRMVESTRCRACSHLAAHIDGRCEACVVGGGCCDGSVATFMYDQPRSPGGVVPIRSEEETFKQALQMIASIDIAGLVKAQGSYGTSWRNRGGVGAFMMLARKWDRLENQVKKHDWDIFKAIAADRRPEGIMDDIRDLRRYLLLVEEHMWATNVVVPQVAKE
jgi:hypothetical protein